MAQGKTPKKSGKSPADEMPVDLPRRGRSAPIAADSPVLLANAFARKGFSDPALVLRWSEIAGAEVARLAVPVKLIDGPEGGTLTLKAEPGAALFLQHESRTLCERINAWAGRPLVSRLRFVQGALEGRSGALPRPVPQAPPGTDPAHRFTGHEALRDALLALARWRRD